MSVTSTASFTAATGNGAATAFPFTFACKSEAEIAVFVNGVVQAAGFTVTLNPDFNGGTVTFSTAPAAGVAITMASDPSFAEDTGFENAGSYNPATVDELADRAAIRTIYLKDAVDRAPLVPHGETMGLLPKLADRIGKLLGFDADGNPVPASGTGADAALRTDLAAPTGGSTLIMHKSAAGGTTYARTLRQWGTVGGLSDDNVFNWIDSDLDASILDGTIADDVVAMVMAAINEKSVLGGVVDMPQGTFLVGAYQGGGTVITVPSNVRLKGRGASSIIRLKTGTNFNLVNVAANAENVEIDHLLLDGNCASDVNNSSGSTLRSAGCLNTWLHHLYIRNSAAYGIGLETGSQIRLTIDHIDIDGTMADGIDMKNPNNANKGVSISNVNIRNYALNPEETVQTGIDCRGPVKLMNIFIELPGKSDAVGIRFRQGEAGDPTTYPWGIGGHNSTLDNFYIDMGGGANTFGVNAVARGVTISNGKVFRARRGVFAEDSGFSASQVYAFNCSEYGILLDALDGTFDADDSILTACAAYDTVGTGISVEADRCQINACYGEGNSVADVAIASTADQTVINGGSFRSTTKFTLNGTNTRIEDVAGYQQSFTVAQLTTKLTGVVAGRRAFVTDLASTTYGGTATGGGSGKAWCTYDGSAWKVG